MSRLKNLTFMILTVIATPTLVFADTGSTEVFINIPASPNMIDEIVNPNTGDTTTLMPYIYILVGAILLLILILFLRGRRKKDDK